ncbi:MAG: class A beta-lactamase [Pseudorhodoplanes sp.]|nr:class A beta-lactamase [Pseudorhodoplanes sp.]
MTTRREWLLGAASLAWLGGAVQAARSAQDALTAQLARIEGDSGGRLGVAVLDTGTGRQAAHRGNERFPMCSTFKLLAAAAILARVDAGKERLDRRVVFNAGDLVTYSPATEKHAGDGMAMAAICEAAVTLSDNTAGNLMLEALGGPAGLTAWLRAIGDGVSRLDRNELSLNEALPGDPRDTTTPQAMVTSVHTILFGKALGASSQERLTQWLLASKTGGTRLRAGLPENWRSGDKTGSGARGTTNDVAVIWPPNRKPLIVAAFLTGTSAPPEARDATLASVGRAVAAAF